MNNVHEEISKNIMKSAIENDILSNINLFLMIFNVITIIFNQINMIFIKSKTISYILLGIFIAILMGVIVMLVWSALLSKADKKLFDTINDLMLQELSKEQLDDSNE